jgi:hypothetical protein
VAEESEGEKTKWASEAYAFLALFRRLRKRLPGLLMLEFGWGFLIRLVAPLAEDKGTAGATPAVHGTAEPSAFMIFLIGAAAIAAYWFLLSSDAWKVPFLWLARFGRPLASIGLSCTIVLVTLATSPLLILAALGDHLHFRLWLKRQDPARIAAAREAVAAPKLREIHEKESKASNAPPRSFEDWKKEKGDDWISREQAKIAEPTLRSKFDSEIKMRFMIPWEAFAAMLARWRVRLDSTALIGLAPFHSYSFEEEQKSAKAPLQIFAASIRRLRLGLSNRMITSRIRFLTVPEIVLIESDDSARRWRARLGLDTLMWGSYLSSNPPRIWLNLENKQIEDTRNNDTGDAERLDLHPVRSGEVDFAMMEVDQDDPIECYLVVLVCLLRTLQRRPEPRKFLFWESLDTLAWKKYSGERIFLRLVRPLLAKLETLPKTTGLDGSPAHLLVAYVSNWAAGQISWWQPGEQELWLLRDMLRHCIRLDDASPEHCYRLGAVLCLLDDEAGAQDAFTQAQKRDGRSEYYSPDMVAISAGSYLELAYDRSSISAGDAAAAVAYVLRAVTLGGAGATKHISGRFEKTDYWKWQTRLATYGVEPDWTTTDRILCSTLGLDLPVPAVQSTKEPAEPAT